MTGRPLDRYPPNRRFLRFRGEPVFLLTSGEHYGAVCNLDFDLVTYLDELQRHRFNYTRIFSGTYVEEADSLEFMGWPVARGFENTLAPRPGRYLAPWARSTETGYRNGGAKFDLERWDEAYWERLREFVRQAGLRGIIVEYTLFCVMYQGGAWDTSPMNPSNHVNGVGHVGHEAVYTLDNDGLLECQLRFARRAARELGDFDNVFLELVNEGYIREQDDAWTDAMVAALQDEFARSGRELLLAWNLSSEYSRADRLNPGLSIVNFHYATPPLAPQVNHDLEKVVGYDESGLIGLADDGYRIHAWQFLLAGGSGFNHLDWSFAPCGHEDGSLVPPAAFPSGGSADLRAQLTVLRDFLIDLPFATMRPSTDFLVTELTGAAQVYGIAAVGEAYALHLVDLAAADLHLNVEAGHYRVRWLDPVTGADLTDPARLATSGDLVLEVPGAHRELALSVLRHRSPTETDAAAFDFAGAARTD